MSAERNRGGLIWVAAGACLWGSDTFFRRPLTTHLSSTTIVLVEHLVSFLILLPLLWNRRSEWTKLRWPDWAAVIAISWGGSALGTMLFTEAVRLGNPTTAVLLQKAQPMIAALLAGVFLAEPLGIPFWIRFAVSVAGAYLINFGAQLPGQGLAATSALFALGAAALWGTSTVLGRFLLDKISFTTMTALRIATAVPLLGALAGLQSPGWSSGVTRSDAVTLAFLALVPGLAGLMIYYRGLSRSYASRAAIAELCFPCTALLLNWIRFGTGISLAQTAGFVLLTGAILSLEKERGTPISGTVCVHV